MPKFWRDSGHYNDAVVSLSITVSLAAWIWLGWQLDSQLLMLGALFLGPLTGLLIGVSLVAILATYFSKNSQRPNPAPADGGHVAEL